MTSIQNICKHAYFVESDTDNILSEEWLTDVIENNPLTEYEKDCIPFICIGKNVFVEYGTQKDCIDCLYLSPSGKVIIAESSTFNNEICCESVLQQINTYIKEIKTWSFDKLNSIASDYTYKTRGQSFNIIDLFAERGFIKFADEEKLKYNIELSLQNSDFLIFLACKETNIVKR